MNGLEERLVHALEEHAEQITPSPDAWAENQRRLRRGRTGRRAGAGLLAAAAAATVLFGLGQLRPAPADQAATERVTPPPPTAAVVPPALPGLRLPDGNGAIRSASYDGTDFCLSYWRPGMAQADKECVGDAVPKPSDALGTGFGKVSDFAVPGEWFLPVARNAATVHGTTDRGTLIPAELLGRETAMPALVVRISVPPGTVVTSLVARDSAGRVIGTKDVTGFDLTK